MSVEAMIGVAQELGIVVTRAPCDSDVFECWADRVAMARVYEKHGDTARLARAIAEANRYAIAQCGRSAGPHRPKRRLAQPSRSIRSRR
jgi:hypothetical protein